MCIRDRVMEALLRSNREQTVGYGKDGYCESARELIKKEACCETAQVYFIPGGTQTNLLVISSLLRPVSYTHLDVYKRQLPG